jgi:hypothetical protein
MFTGNVVARETVENGVEREVSADEFIDGMERALLELVEGNLLLSGIEIGHEGRAHPIAFVSYKKKR